MLGRYGMRPWMMDGNGYGMGSTTMGLGDYVEQYIAVSYKKAESGERAG